MDRHQISLTLHQWENFDAIFCIQAESESNAERFVLLFK